MKRTLALAGATAGITIVLGAPTALAEPDPYADCVGQVTSDLAQLGRNFGADFRGIGGLNKVAETEGGDLNAIVRNLCNSQPLTPG